MKLFITNKKTLDDLFNNKVQTRDIHISAFNELNTSINAHNSIPLVLTPNYDEYGICIFDFISKKGDIYFYEFSTTAK